MPDKKSLIDAYFIRHKIDWKIKVREDLKSIISIQKFFRPAETQRINRLDDTPTEEKSRQNKA